MDEIDVAYNDALQARPSTRPLIEMTIPSVLDGTIAPPGKHVINLFIQYTPFHLKDGDWQDRGIRDAFAKTCFDLVDEYAPGFTESIIGYDMLTPPDLERVLWTHRSTPVKGLYMCGAGSHPGGRGVMGAPGRNAASVVVKDRSKQQ